VLQSSSGPTSIFYPPGTNNPLVVNKNGTLVAIKDVQAIKVWTKTGTDWTINPLVISADIMQLDVCQLSPTSDIIGYARTDFVIEMKKIERTASGVSIIDVSSTTFQYKGYTEQNYINSIKFNHDCTMVTISTTTYKVAVFKLDDDKLTQFNLFENNRFTSHFNSVLMSRFHPTQNIVYSSSKDLTIKEWILDSSNHVQSYSIFKYPHFFATLAYLPTVDKNLDKMIIVKDEDSTISMFDLNLKTFTHNFFAETNNFEDYSFISLSGNGNVLFICQPSRWTVQVWKKNMESNINARPYIFDRFLVDEYNGKAFSNTGFSKVITDYSGEKLLNFDKNKVKVWENNGNNNWTAVTLVYNADQNLKKYGYSGDNIRNVDCDYNISTIISQESSLNYIKLWKKNNIGDWTPEKIPSTGNAYLNQVTLSAINKNGTMVATIGNDVDYETYTIKLWKQNSNNEWDSVQQKVVRFENPSIKILKSLSISHNNEYILYIDYNNVKMYNITGDSIHTIKSSSTDQSSHTHDVNSALFDNQYSGIKIITSSDDQTIKIWTRDENTNNYTVDVLVDSKSNMAASTAIFGNEQNLVISSGTDYLVKIWNKNRETWSVTPLLYNLTNNLLYPSTDYSLNTIVFFARCVLKVQTMDHTRQWNNQDLLPETSYCTETVSEPQISGDGNIILFFKQNGNNYTGVIWKKDQTDGKYKVHTTSIPISHQQRIYITKLSKDGKHALTVHQDRNVRLWKSSADYLTWELWNEVGLQYFDTNTLTSFDLHPSGEKFAIGLKDGTIKIYTKSSTKLDLPTKISLLGEDLPPILCSTNAHLGGITSLKFDSSGKVLSSTDLYGTIKTWKVDTRQEMSTNSIPTNNVQFIYGVATESLQKLLHVYGNQAYLYKQIGTPECDQYCGNATYSEQNAGNYCFYIYVMSIVFN
jgi:WD40 repeat protein